MLQITVVHLKNYKVIIIPISSTVKGAELARTGPDRVWPALKRFGLVRANFLQAENSYNPYPSTVSPLVFSFFFLNKNYF